jgi:hypothetical protein
MTIYPLGRKPKLLDHRNLLIHNYMDVEKLSALPHPPLSRSYLKKLPKNTGMMLNDKLGCCPLAAAGHIIQCLTANDSTMVTVPDSAILKAYEDVGGYVPGRPETDNGAYMLDALKYWKKTGIGGHKILAFAEIVDYRDHALMNECLNLFGNVYIGLGLPISAQTQAVWDVSTGPDAQVGSWGGHAVNVEAFSPFVRKVRTWGETQQSTCDFDDTYIEEAYVVLSTDWSGPDRIAPNGFNLDALMTDLLAVA